MNEAAEENAEARAETFALSRETVDAVLAAVEAGDHDAAGARCSSRCTRRTSPTFSSRSAGRSARR